MLRHAIGSLPVNRSPRSARTAFGVGRRLSAATAVVTVCSLWGIGLAAVTAQTAAAAPAVQTFDRDANRDGVADCWFVEKAGSQTSTALLTTGRTGRAQQLAGSRFERGASLQLALEDGCVVAVASGEKVRTAAWTLASGKAELWLEGRRTGGSWSRIGRVTVPSGKTWTRVTLPTLTVPAGVVQVRVQARLAGVGRLAVDDLTVERVAAANRPGNASPGTRPTPTTTPPAPGTTTPSAPRVLFAPAFPASDGLVTNEYAHWNSDDATALRSPYWRLTSGSLFSKDGTGWSGKPDDREPDATSSNGTDSAIFRALTPKLAAPDAVVRMKLRLNRMTTTPSTPAVAWDGIHLFLRYQSETNLYYASVARRDGAVVLKKKCHGGSENGGTYYTLAQRFGLTLPFGSWAEVGATVKNNPDGSVALTLHRDGQTVLTAVDRGVGCPTIRSAGSLGVRGDNTDFQFAGFVASAG